MPGLNAYSPAASAAVATAAKPYIIGLPTAQPDSRFGTVYYYQSGGAASYNGLIATVTHKSGPSGGVITAGYTLGKNLDTGRMASPPLPRQQVRPTSARLSTHTTQTATMVHPRSTNDTTSFSTMSIRCPLRTHSTAAGKSLVLHLHTRDCHTQQSIRP